MKYKTEVCPNCGSGRIDYASLEASSGTSFLGIGLPEKYYCKNCGYTGSVIIKVDKRKIKKMKFKNFNYKKFTPVKERETRKIEVMKPVFTLTVMFFLLIAVLLLFPRYNVTRDAVEFDNNIVGATTITNIPKGTVTSIETESEPVTYITMETRNIDEIDQALGLENTIGFIVPLFFLFLVIGFSVLALSSHWERLKLFY